MPRLCSERIYNAKLDLKIREVFKVKERNCASVFLRHLRRIQPPVLSDDILANIDKKLNLNYLGTGNDEILDALKFKSNWFEIIIEVLSNPKLCEQDLADDLMRLKGKLDAELEIENTNCASSSDSFEMPQSSNNIQGERNRKRTFHQGAAQEMSEDNIQTCEKCKTVVKNIPSDVEPDDRGRCLTVRDSFRKTVLNMEHLKERKNKNCHYSTGSNRSMFYLACRVYEEWEAGTLRLPKKSQKIPSCVLGEIQTRFPVYKKKQRKKKFKKHT